MYSKELRKEPRTNDYFFKMVFLVVKKAIMKHSEGFFGYFLNYENNHKICKDYSGKIKDFRKEVTLIQCKCY